MKQIRKILYVLLFGITISGLLTKVVPETSIITEVQAAAVLKAPRLLSASQIVRTTNLKFSWEAVEGAEGYRVYRRTEGGKWKLVKTITGTKTLSYKDTTCEPGKIYYYTVRAGKEVSGKMKWGSYYKNGIRGLVISPTKLVSAKSDENSITVNWEAKENVTGYYVYRRLSMDTSWEKIAKLTGQNITSYKDTTARECSVYFYTIRAYRTIGNKLYPGSYYKSGVGNVILPKPEHVSTTPISETSLMFNWKTISGIKGYRVYRKTNGGKWELQADIPSEYVSYYKDENVEVGTKYRYTVRAYTLVGKKIVMGKYYSGKTITMQLVAPELVSARAVGTTGVTVTWNAVAGADGYRVFVKGDTGWKSLQILTGGDKLTYTVTGLAPNTSYNFTVRAYKVVNGEKVWGKYNTQGIYGRTDSDEIKLNYTEVALTLGELYRDMKLEGTAQSPKWYSSDESIVKVETGNVLWAVGKGTTIVTAVYNDVEYPCKVIVETPEFKLDKTIIEVGESTYAYLEGTVREIRWLLDGQIECVGKEASSEYVKLEIIDDHTVKLTGLKPGASDIHAGIDRKGFSKWLYVKGTIDASKSDVSLDLGETTEVIITSDYSSVDLEQDYDTSVVEAELIKMEDGKWKLKLLGLGEGTTSVTVKDSSYNSEIDKDISVTVKDSGSVSSSHFKLKRYIKNNGTYSEGWYTIGYAGYYEDVPGVTYTWSISYNETSDEYEYGIAIMSDEDMLVMAMTGNPTKSSTMASQYMYYNETTEGYFVAESSLNINTYAGQNLTFKVSESEGMATADVNELMSVANDTLILGFEGWNTHVLKKLDLNMKVLGFKLYNGAV